VKDNRPFYLAVLAILAAVLLMSEVVACQWHADDLSDGCQSNALHCNAKRAEAKP
jgi:hypothetical protein